MKSKLLVIIILILSLVLTSCISQPGKVQAKNQSTGTINNDEDNSENLSDGKKKETPEERQELEKQRKIELGEFYVPLPKLGQEAEIKTVKARALYITANVAGFQFKEEDINYYAEYIKSISGESIKPVDTSRMSEINKLEKALAICESTEINSLVIDVKNDDGLVAWNSEIEIVDNIKSNWSAPLKHYERLMD